MRGCAPINLSRESMVKELYDETARGVLEGWIEEDKVECGGTYVVDEIHLEEEYRNREELD